MSDELRRLRERARRKRPEVKERNRETARARKQEWRERGGESLREKERVHAQQRRARRRAARKELENKGEDASARSVSILLAVERFLEQENAELQRKAEHLEPLPATAIICPETGSTCLRCEDGICFLLDPHWSLGDIVE